jgi:hypothetical protein
MSMAALGPLHRHSAHCRIDGPMHLVTGLAIGGPYERASNSSPRFPAFMRIDYVRVWPR